MATKVHMEALSPTMEEGQVVRWLKSEGDVIANGDVLAEIETDKATMELVARGEGVLRVIFFQEGATVPVGGVIGVIAAPDEDISQIAPSLAVGQPAVASEGSAGQTPALLGGEAVDEGEAAAAESQPDELGNGDGRVKASPVARRLAADSGVDLSGVVGSGPGGRIVKRDVETALEGGVPVTDTTPAGVPALAAATFDGPEFEDLPLTQIRKTIARRLSESLGPIPHFFLNIQVDMTRMIEGRKSVNAMLEGSGQKVSVNDLIIRATAEALSRHPEVNAHWLGDKIRRFHAVHIGVAVAVEDGLITPVVRNADRKGVVRIGQEVREMAGRAREKRLKPEEYTGSTFSISNLGMFGIHEFTAVINPPEAGILAIGGIEETPTFVDGELVARPVMRITMSCDHRVIDGATGARFLQTLKSMLEEPLAILA